MICEAPRLGPYRQQIEMLLGEVTSARVTVKATTNEGMGWIGRGEGIACMASPRSPTTEPERPRRGPG